MPRAQIAGLVVMCAVPFAAAAAPAAAAPVSVAEQVFVERLRALVAAKRWTDAARHIQQAQALRPAPDWLVARDGDVRLAQIGIAIGRADVPEATKATRLFLNGEESRAAQVLALAQELWTAGEGTAAVALAKEIVRRAPDHAAAVRALAAWEPLAARKTHAERAAPESMKEEGAALVARLRAAHAADDVPAMLSAARPLLNGDRARGETVLAIAREFFAKGDVAAARLLTREVVRRTPNFPAAARQLEEFGGVEKN